MLVISGKSKVEEVPSLWRRIEDKGWLRDLQSRIVLGVWLSTDRQVSVLRDLAAYLGRQPQVTQVAVVALNPTLRDSLVDGIVWQDLDIHLGLQVYSSLIGELIAVPDILLEPFSVVTVCEVHPDSRYGIWGPYLAQARWLSPDDAQLHRLYAAELAYEAYRLVGNDLCIALGIVEQSDAPMCERFWLAGRSTAAIEVALGRAVGLSVSQMPQLNYITQREQVDLNMLQIEGDLPDLRSWRAMSLQARSEELLLRVARMAYRSKRDLNLVRQNLYRVRRFFYRLLRAKVRR